jgi:hypothetical protein
MRFAIPGDHRFVFFGREVHPLNHLRRRLTSGLEVGTSEEEVRRGEEIDALVTISSVRRLRDVEVGLVCTEYYKAVTRDSEPGDSSYVEYDAIAHQTWVPVDTTLGVQSIRFRIPEEAPFSYHGEVALSFKWEVIARAHRRPGLDARATHEITVLP